jgi:DNA polymerase-3 subunit delta'
MLFEKMIGQKVAKKILRQAWADDRLAQSYLFYGPDGVGKEMAGLELAMALNCESSEADQPCRQCNACRKTAAYIHPDFHYFFPKPHPSSDSDKRKLAEEISEMLKEKEDKTYLSFDFGNRPVAISIDDIRELQERLEFLPYEGKRKVVLMTGVDAMTTEAANAFLKILEEPSPTTNFILTTDRPNALLPTILSRCQKVRFDLLSREEVIKALSEGYGQDDESAETLAEISGNSLGKALQMTDQDLLEERDLAIRLLGASVEGKQWEMLDAIDQIAKDRGRPARVLEMLSVVISDLLRMKISRNNDAANKKPGLAQIEKKLNQQDLSIIVRSIEKSRTALERNVNPRLCLLAACNITQGENDAFTSDRGSF